MKSWEAVVLVKHIIKSPHTLVNIIIKVFINKCSHNFWLTTTPCCCKLSLKWCFALADALLLADSCHIPFLGLVSWCILTLLISLCKSAPLCLLNIFMAVLWSSSGVVIVIQEMSSPELNKAFQVWSPEFCVRHITFLPCEGAFVFHLILLGLFLLPHHALFVVYSK